MTRQRDLDLWMNGQHVGTWFRSRTGTSGLNYARAWTSSPEGRALSVSLPMPAGGGDVMGPRVDHYFDNLLPDSDTIRERLRARFSAPSTNAPDLLAAIGRDCVGALQLLPAGSPAPTQGHVESTALDDAQIESILRQASGADAAADALTDDFRISIAGAQEKTALLRIGQRWHLPHGSTPTTHILKLPLGLVGNMRADMHDSVENEWLCAKLLAALGLPVAPTEMARFGDQRALVVERFDRRWVEGGQWIVRLPQEDFCQAHGWPGPRKYESDGGPGIQAGLSLLAAGSNPRDDRLRFALAQLAFWLLAATDGHAKNFSIFLERGGGYRLTPLYDVLSAWPIIGDGPNQISQRRVRLAMALRGRNTHYQIWSIRVRHWFDLARQCGADDAFDRMVALVLLAPQALREVEAELPAGFPMRVFRAVRAGMLAQAERFIGELGEDGLGRDPVA